MPWVRIDENAMDHPKMGGLSDGAFRLWVQGLAYCQKFLTDGAILDVSLRGLRAYSPKRRDALEVAGLWDRRTDGGVMVHDYLDWNESRDHVLQARKAARDRMARLRDGSMDVRANMKRTTVNVPCQNERDPLHSTSPTEVSKDQKPREGDAADAAPAADGADLPAYTADGAGTHLQQAEAFAETWNRLTIAPLPRCRDLTAKRKRHIRARLSERPLTEWEDIISQIQASAFCRGENDRGWLASFDWLIGSADVAVKVLEGKYDDRPRLVSERPFTQHELEQAQAWRRAVGGCGHQPKCESREDCIGRFIRGRLRGQKVAS